MTEKQGDTAADHRRHARIDATLQAKREGKVEALEAALGDIADVQRGGGSVDDAYDHVRRRLWRLTGVERGEADGG
jgi:hypothetical protein